MPTSLDAIVADLSGCDRQERIDLLLDFAKACPRCPIDWRLIKTRPIGLRNVSLRSTCSLSLMAIECRLHADAPIEAPTVRGFVSLLIEGLTDTTVDEVFRFPATWSSGCGLGEILGMLRVRGLTGVLRRLKAEVTRAAIDKTRTAIDDRGTTGPGPG